MLISNLIAAVEGFADPALAEEWDNVGLVIGSAEWECAGLVLLTIDLTEAVAEEAVRRKCGAVIAYHPPIFGAIKRGVDGAGAGAGQRVAVRLIRAGIAVYSPHTALDAATGGVTDWLADGLIDPVTAAAAKPGVVCRHGADRRPLRSHPRRDPDQEIKIVTFAPADAVEKVRAGLASAGAGRIGNYELCSFAGMGTGTFRGNEQSRPAVGQAGKLESVEELRLEMVCPRRALALALTTLRQFHPYEEPAIDVYPLDPQPDRQVGVGRRLTLDHPAAVGEIAQRLKRHIGASGVQVAAPDGDVRREVARIGVVPGSGGSLAECAMKEGCEVFVTGEMKHHEVMAALAGGMSVVLGGHTTTERGYLPRLARVLAERLAGASFVVSEMDREPLVGR